MFFLEVNTMEYTCATNDDIANILMLWNQSMPRNQITIKQLTIIVFCDDNYDENLVRVAYDGKVFVGFCIGMKRVYPFLEKGLQEEKAWIVAMAVDEAYRRKHIGTHLLKDVEQQWKSKVTSIVLATYSPYYFLVGIDILANATNAFFIKNGYQKTDCAYRMRMQFDSYQLPIEHKQRMLVDAGYTICPFTYEKGKALLDFLHTNFSVGWRFHAIQAMRAQCAQDTIILCMKDHEVVGYVQRAIDGDESRFGPFGVDAKIRNKGIGSILVQAMFASMKEKMVKDVWFHSTDEAGKRFYTRHGMVVEQVLYHYDKKVIT